MWKRVALLNWNFWIKVYQNIAASWLFCRRAKYSITREFVLIWYLPTHFVVCCHCQIHLVVKGNEETISILNYKRFDSNLFKEQFSHIFWRPTVSFDFCNLFRTLSITITCSYISLNSEILKPQLKYWNTKNVDKWFKSENKYFAFNVNNLVQVSKL